MIPADAATVPTSPVPSMTHAQYLRWMFGFLRPVRPLVAIAILWLIAGVVLEVFTVKLPGDAVNRIQQIHYSEVASAGGFLPWIRGTEPDAVALRRIVYLLFALVVAMGLVRYLREVAYSKMSMNMVYFIREAVYDKLQRVGFAYHDQVSTGQLINRALSDLQNVRTFIQTAVLVSLEIVLVVGGYIVLMATRSPWIAALALVPLPVWTWYILRFSKRIQPLVKSALESEDRNVSIITENIAGVHVVKAFATQRHEQEKYGRNCDDFMQRVLRRIRMFADFNPYIRTIAQASYISLFLVTGILVIKGRMMIGDFMILQMAMGAILARLQQIATINEQYQNAIVSARRLHEVLHASPTVPEKPDAFDLPPGAGEVVFENVTFGYDPAKPVVHQVSFRARSGSIVAIVGPTGSGKSTLVNLISRFYDPQQGRILLDGYDLRDVTLSSLRRNVGFVFQETYLFSDTVAANIAYGRPNISPGEIEAAARLAQAHEFIEQMPSGYESVLAERGASLSGGQRQRLAIARAMVTNPSVLVLDDATAAIDPETEDLIRRGLRLTLYGRTTFVIAHRISTVKQADLVIVLDHGRITQMGTHEQLLGQPGHYRDIAAVQLYADDIATGAEAPSHMDRVKDPRQVAVAAPEPTAERADVTVE